MEEQVEDKYEINIEGFTYKVTAEDGHKAKLRAAHLFQEEHSLEKSIAELVCRATQRKLNPKPQGRPLVYAR